MLTHEAVMASFLPRAVLQDLPAETASLAPRERVQTALVLFSDIARFSEFGRRLVDSGAEGVERLPQILNLYLGKQIECIEAAGGDVVKFAGDAIVAVWPIGAEDRGALARRVCACALELQAQIALIGARDPSRRPLEIRVSLGLGELRSAHVGGHYGRWLFHVSGPGILQAIAADRLAQPGWIVLPDELAALARASTQPLTGELSRLLDLRTTRPPPAPLPAAPVCDLAVMRAYLPSPILAQLQAGHDEWLAELRTVTVLFIKLGGLELGRELDLSQRVIHAVQREVHRREGTINKLSVDDKGVTVVAAFGLPPLSHRDDAARGVQAALAVDDELRGLGVPVGIGVARGRTFCGTVGNASRREYTLIGASINLAARLMQEADGEVLCDEATARAAQDAFGFVALPPRTLKGWEQPIPVFRPRLTGSAAPPRPRRDMVGRRGELARITAMFDQLTRGGAGGRVLLQGEAGMGKSVLVDAAIAEARRRGIRVLHGECVGVEQATSYFVWRAVLGELLGHDPADARARLAARLADDPALARLAPLIGEVVPLGLPENEFTGELTGKLRQDNTNDLLVGLLDRTTRAAPALIVLDDVHWIDAASWALTRMVQTRTDRIVLMLVGRPDDRAWLEEFGRDAAQTDVSIHLGGLAEDDVAALAAHHLGAARISRELLALLTERAAGNPFFTEQLACALRDTGLVETVGDECRLRVQADSSATALLLPDTLHGIITARIDRLQPAQILTLKVASVIGRLFRFSVLRDIHPVERDPAHLRSTLAGLAELDITPLVSPEPELEYIFKHIITHEVTYNLMLYAQRRELHRAVAEWIERHHAADLAPYNLLLAHHWEHAGRTGRAVELILQALERAHRLSAGRDLAALLRRVRELCERHGHRLDDDQALQLDYYAAMTHVALGEHEKARVALSDLLDRLGMPVPRSNLGLGLGLGGKMLRQGLARRVTWLGARPSHLPPARARMAVTALNALVGIGMMAADQMLIGWATMQVVGLGDGWAPPEELAQAHALAGVMYSALGDSQNAERYLARAHALVGPQRSPQRSMTLVTAAIPAIGSGDWDRLDPLLDEAVELATYLGDRMSAAFALVYRGDAHLIRGRLVAAATDIRASAHNFEQMGNRLSQRTVAAQLARIDLHHGRLPAVVAELSPLLDTMLDKKEHHAATLPLFGPLIEAHLHQDQIDEALAVDRRVAPILAGITPSTHSFYRLFAAQVELWLAVLARDPAARRSARARAEEALARLRKTAKMFPVGRASLQRVEGQLAAATGDLRGAGRAFADAAATAQRLGYRKEEALARYLAGLHGAAERPDAALQAAHALFSQLRMPVFVARCEDALRRKS